MYPLNLTLQSGDVIGHAVANCADEHRALTEAGYLPAFVEPANEDGETVESVRAKLDVAGLAYDGRYGLAKLISLLPA